MEIAHREIFHDAEKAALTQKLKIEEGDLICSPPTVAERVRNPRQNSFVLRRRFEDAGQADD